MYFYEILALSDINLVIKEFLKLCDNSPNIALTEESVRTTINILSNTKPHLSESFVIVIKKEKDFDDSFYDCVFVLNKNDSERYGLEINPWEDTIGYLVNDESVSEYGREVFTALTLWEMTWFGYDEKTIELKVKSWNETD